METRIGRFGVRSVLATCCLIHHLGAAPLEHWSIRHPGVTSDELTDVIFQDGKFVAVGWAGTLLVSMDATNWTRQNVDAGIDFWGVKYLNGKFFAVGGDQDY